MDQLITWLLAAIAAASFTLAFLFDQMAEGTDFTRLSKMLVLALRLLAYGTFIVSTLGITGHEDTQGFFVAFNRAVLAGVGVTLAYQTGCRYRRSRRVHRG